LSFFTLEKGAGTPYLRVASQKKPRFSVKMQSLDYCDWEYNLTSRSANWWLRYLTR